MSTDTNEAKELLKEYLQKIQFIDTEIARLKEDRKVILDDAKSDGIDKAKLNKAISEVRRELDKKPAELSEEEMYVALVKELDIIKSVKE